MKMNLKELFNKLNHAWVRMSKTSRGVIIFISICAFIYIIQTWNIVHTSPTTIGPAHNQVPVDLFKYMTTPQRDVSDLSLTANFHGRLGNNLFIYASLIGLAKKQNRVPVLVPNYEILYQNGKEFLYGFNLYHARRSNTVTRWLRIRESSFGMLDERFLSLPETDVMIDGFFQAWTYFENAKKEIREDLTFSDEIRLNTNRILKPVYEQYPGYVHIGVHVRRGDFTSKKYSSLGYIAAPFTFFQKAFDYIQKKLVTKKLVFIVASDDTAWCKENFLRSGFEHFHFLEPAQAILHLSVLAQSDHMVISGGTYGWWSAWLAGGWGTVSEGSNTTVVYFSGFPVPGSHLAEHFKKEEFYPPHWIPLQ